MSEKHFHGTDKDIDIKWQNFWIRIPGHDSPSPVAVASGCSRKYPYKRPTRRTTAITRYLLDIAEPGFAVRELVRFAGCCPSDTREVQFLEGRDSSNQS
jgi:hypothetical protein